MMRIFEIATGKEIEAIIQPLNDRDVTIIKNSKSFNFDWQKLKGKIYKLAKVGSPDVLGLMSLIEHGVGWDAIEIELLEVGEENVGKNKSVDRIAGCLIAFACRESIKTGHGGFVFLKPKTELERWYQKAYGFEYTGFNMASFDTNSVELIKKYL